MHQRGGGGGVNDGACMERGDVKSVAGPRVWAGERKRGVWDTLQGLLWVPWVGTLSRLISKQTVISACFLATIGFGKESNLQK